MLACMGHPPTHIHPSITNPTHPLTYPPTQWRQPFAISIVMFVYMCAYMHGSPTSTYPPSNWHVTHNWQFWTFFWHLTSYLNHVNPLQGYFYVIINGCNLKTMQLPIQFSQCATYCSAVLRVPTRPGKPGKMRVHLENLEISWNFEKFNKYHGKMTWNLEKLGGY